MCIIHRQFRMSTHSKSLQKGEKKALLRQTNYFFLPHERSCQSNRSAFSYFYHNFSTPQTEKKKRFITFIISCTQRDRCWPQLLNAEVVHHLRLMGYIFRSGFYTSVIKYGNACQVGCFFFFKDSREFCHYFCLLFERSFRSDSLNSLSCFEHQNVYLQYFFFYENKTKMKITLRDANSFLKKSTPLLKDNAKRVS